ALAISLAVFGCKKKEEANTASKTAEGTSATAPTAPAPTTPPPAAAPAKATPKTGKDLAQVYLDCGAYITAGKLDDFKTNCVANDFVGHNDGMDDVKGSDAMIAHFKEMRTGFPDMKFDPALILVSGRNIFAIAQVTGTNSGPMKMHGQEMPATNKKSST